MGAAATSKGVAQAAYKAKGPNAIKEVIYGISLGFFAGGLWKMYHWNVQKKHETFYDLLEQGRISTVRKDLDK